MATLNRRPLMVVPNPYCHLDEHGFPAGAYPIDFEVSAGRRMYVGATLEALPQQVTSTPQRENPSKLDLFVPDPQPVTGDHRWRFTLEPTEIPDTPHHRNGLRERSLLPADERTHRAVLGAGLPFKPWQQALSASKQAAIEEWTREHDGEEPAFVAAEQETVDRTVRVLALVRTVYAAELKAFFGTDASRVSDQQAAIWLKGAGVTLADIEAKAQAKAADDAAAPKPVAKPKER